MTFERLRSDLRDVIRFALMRLVQEKQRVLHLDPKAAKSRVSSRLDKA